MGVQGLTSYVRQSADVFYEDFELTNSILVIDGYSLAACLYNSTTKINSSFGGDYDKYASVVKRYFEILNKCNVTPVVVCDGGYEKKKLHTIKRRSLRRVQVFENVTPSHADSQCFPLLMRQVFRQHILEMGLTLLQSDFEADNEIAALAKMLDAPVLSNDSDFFIFDVQYIPLSSMPFNHCVKVKKGHFYIPCKIFRLDNLLSVIGGLPKNMLPLLATVLGNDYVNASLFKNFYSQLNISKSKIGKPGQRVKCIVNWLKHEDFDSALVKILNSTKKETRNLVKLNINQTIKGYTNLYTTLDAYLPEKIYNRIQQNNCISELSEFYELNCSSIDSESDSNIDEEHLLGSEIENILTSDSENESNDNEKSTVGFQSNDSPTIVNIKSSLFPKWLLDESRKGNVCPSINSLLSLKIYFFTPQAEDYSYPHSGAVALKILQVIISLLNLDRITYWARLKHRYVGTYLNAATPTSNISFPKLSELNDLKHCGRMNIICWTLNVNQELLTKYFPPDWHLYIASVVYWIQSNEQQPFVKPCHIHAVLITLITLSVIGSKIGRFWQKKTFMLKFKAKLGSLEKRAVSNPISIFNTITEAISHVSEDDCILAMALLVEYFQVNQNLGRHSRSFSRPTIHLYAQLQAIFELTNTLNSLLLMPFKRSSISMFYNGTFLYNFTANFKTRSNILSYVENLFSAAPSVKILYKTVHEMFYHLIPSAPKQKVKRKT